MYFRVFAAAAVAVAIGGGFAVAAAAHSNSSDSSSRERKLAARTDAARPHVVAAGSPTRSVLVPITPCRIVNTTKNHHPLAPNSNRAFTAVTASTISSQGGHSGGCGVPSTATAVAISLTAVNGTRAGHLTVFPSGSVPTARALSYQAGAEETSSVIEALHSGSLTVHNTGQRKVDLLMDVTGYWVEPSAATVSSSGTLVSGSADVVSTQKNVTGSYTVTFNHNLTNCIAEITAEQSYYNAGGYTSGSSVTVYTRDVTTTNSPYADAEFSVTVTC